MKYNLLFIIKIFFIFSNIYCKTINEDRQQLLFVYEHSRHGNRAPNDKKNRLYNNVTKLDIYNVFWDKPGVLTEFGKLQHFFIGLKNKYKYNNFINFSKYNKNEILLRSTGIKRSTESLYYQALGMYYSENPENENSYIDFNDEIYNYSMPPNINIWKNQKEFDKLNSEIKKFLKNKKINGLNLTSFNSQEKKMFNIKTIKSKFNFVTQRCKNHEKYIKEQRIKYKEIIKNNLFLDNNWEQLKNYLKLENESSLYKRGIAKCLCDQFISDYLNGRKELNNFNKETGINLDNYFQKCQNVYFFYMYNIYCFSKSCILSVSRLMNEIMTYFDSAIEASEKKRKNNIKMLIDVGHDVTVNNFHILMNKAFNVNYTFCNFACNIYFELYKINKGRKYVIYYYDNDQLILNIEYHQFKNTIINLLWSENEIDNFCNGKKENIFKIHKEQDLITNKEIKNRNKKKSPNQKESDL